MGHLGEVASLAELIPSLTTWPGPLISTLISQTQPLQVPKMEIEYANSAILSSTH